MICLVRLVFSAIGAVVEEQNEKMFTHLAQQILPIVCDKHAIVYLDAAKHIPRLTIALRQFGLKSCGYHGKNMSSHNKLKALENWKSGDIDAMVSTSAFGMGIDQADVDVVLKEFHSYWRIWCKCLAELVGMDELLMVSEYDDVDALVNSLRVYSSMNFCVSLLTTEILLYRDDLQMASYWYDGCRDPTLTKFQESWKLMHRCSISSVRAYSH